MENLALDKRLYLTLSEDAAMQGFVGNRFAPEMVEPGTDFPFIVWQDQASRLSEAIGGRQAARSMFSRLIKVVGRGDSFAPLEPIAARIEALIRKSDAAVSLGGVLYYVTGATRLAVYREIEQDGEVSYRHLGASWRFYIERAA